MPDLVSEGHASHMLCVIVQQNHCILIDGLGSSRLLPCMAHVMIAEEHKLFFLFSDGPGWQMQIDTYDGISTLSAAGKSNPA